MTMPSWTGFSSEGFNSLANSLSGIGDDINKAVQRRSLAQLGMDAGAGNYAEAAQKAFKMGDAKTGLALLELGQTAKDRASDAALLGGGSSPTPTVSTGASPAPQASVDYNTSPFRGGLADRIVTAESGGRADAKNPNSSATGAGQFIDSTWLATVKQARPDIANGKTDAQLLALRSDPNLSREMVNAYAKQNGDFLRSQGVPVNDGTLYLAHFAGPQGAAGILQAPGNAMVEQILGSRAVAANPFLRGMRAGDLVAWASRKVGGGRQQVAQAQTQPQTVSDASPADVPAQGSSQAQGFAIPGADSAAAQSISRDPDVQKWTRALATVRTDQGRAAVKAKLDQAVEDAKRRAESDTFRTLDPSEYPRYQVSPETKGPVQVNRRGQLSFPGKAAAEVNVNQSTEKSYDTKVGAAYGEQFIEYQKNARNANSQLGSLNTMEKLIKSPGFYSGTAGERVTALQRLGVALGIQDAGRAAPNELFEKLSKQLVLDKAGGSFGNNISNGDRDYINATTANIGNTPEGNQMIIDMARKIATRDVEVAKMAREYAKKNNGRIDAGFDAELADFVEKNPLFPRVESTAAPAAPPPAQDPAQPAKPDAGGWTNFGGGARIREKP